MLYKIVATYYILYSSLPLCGCDRLIAMGYSCSYVVGKYVTGPEKTGLMYLHLKFDLNFEFNVSNLITHFGNIIF